MEKKRDHIVRVRNKPFFRSLGTMISAGVSARVKRVGFRICLRQMKLPLLVFL
jgi:hypothetical protein